MFSNKQRQIAGEPHGSRKCTEQAVNYPFHCVFGNKSAYGKDRQRYALYLTVFWFRRMGISKKPSAIPSIYLAAQIFRRRTKNRLADPSEICALDFKQQLRRSTICSVSATIGINRSIFSDSRRPSHTGGSQKRPSRWCLPPESVARFKSALRGRYSGTPETAPSATGRASVTR